MSAPRKPSAALLVAVALVSAATGLGLGRMTARCPVRSQTAAPTRSAAPAAITPLRHDDPAAAAPQRQDELVVVPVDLDYRINALQDWILDALWQVESSGATKAPRGDGGRSRGPLQISRAYWLDSRIPGDWSDCEDIGYSRRVAAAYMRRYVPRAWAAANAEVIARTHCAGPDGARQDCSLPYWRKVLTVLQGVR